MGFAGIAAFALAASVLASGSAYAAGPLRPFKLGFWSGGAYTDDRSGAFTHCSAGVAYDSGIDMFVLVTADYRWWLGFIDPHWAWSSTAKLKVELRLDQGTPFPRFATVPSGQLLLVPLPANSHLIETLRHSSQLTLIAETEPFRFKLDNAAAVLEKLTGCVQQSLALEARAALEPPPAASPSLDGKPPQIGGGGGPQASPSAPLSAETGADAQRTTDVAPNAAAATPLAPGRQASLDPSTGSAIAVMQPPAAAPQSPPAATLPQATAPTRPSALEESRLARDFFTTAQLPNARLVVADKPAALASFSAVWRSDNAAGAVKIIPPGPDVSAIGIASNLIAVDPRMCKGDFATARSSATIDRSIVFSAVLSCTEASEQRIAQYFITPRRQGGFVVFAVVDSTAAAGVAAGPDRQMLDLFTRAAARAAENDG